MKRAWRQDLTGHVFGLLRVITEDEKTNDRMWICQCKCGRFTKVRQKQLKSGRTQSCGCIRREMMRNKTLHGSARQGNKSKSYKIWSGMVARCTIPSATGYDRYGALGITVCERWKEYANFIADMGEPESEQSIDRIDSSKGYEPGNCRWATRQQQNENRKSVRWLTFNGMTMNVTQWAKHLGVSKATLYEALEKNPLEYALRERNKKAA